MNPFINNNLYGQNFGSVKTPQQIQQELAEMQQKYNAQYNQMMQNVSNINPNVFNWKYQEQENEIDSLQVPVNGSPFILVGNGIFYVKQFKNGQAYVTTYSFQPLNNASASENKESNINYTKDEKDAADGLKPILDEVLARLDKLESAIKPKVEKVKAEIIEPNPFKKASK